MTKEKRSVDEIVMIVVVILGAAVCIFYGVKYLFHV